MRVRGCRGGCRYGGGVGAEPSVALRLLEDVVQERVVPVVVHRRGSSRVRSMRDVRAREREKEMKRQMNEGKSFFSRILGI